MDAIELQPLYKEVNTVIIRLLASDGLLQFRETATGFAVFIITPHSYIYYATISGHTVEDQQ